MRPARAIRGSCGTAIEFLELVDVGVARVAVEGGESGLNGMQRNLVTASHTSPGPGRRFALWLMIG
jgi:hypothetical protein